MTDGDALHAAIIANPEDDTPRLVYADWCDENGQASRAELIRAQVALALLPAYHLSCTGKKCPACSDLRATVARILTPACCSCAWHQPLGHSDGIKWEFRRGFVEKVTLPYLMRERPCWLSVSVRMLARLPINEVVLTTRPDVTFGIVRERTIHDREKRCYWFVRDWMVYDNDDRYENAMAIQWSLPEEELFVRGTERIEDYRPPEFEAQTAAARTVEGYLKLRWPMVKTWTVPPDPAEMGETVVDFMIAGDVLAWMRAMRRRIQHMRALNRPLERIVVSREFERLLLQNIDANAGRGRGDIWIDDRLRFRGIPVIVTDH